MFQKAARVLPSTGKLSRQMVVLWCRTQPRWPYILRAATAPVTAASRTMRNSGSVSSGRLVDLGRPVVHLGVDVDGVGRGPGRHHLVVPDALQVERLGARARAGDQQVAPVLEDQRRQIGIARHAERGDALVGGQLLLGRVAVQAQRHAIEQRPVVVEVPLLRGRRSRAAPPPAPRAWSAATGSTPGPAGAALVAVEAAAGADHEQRLAGALDAQARRRLAATLPSVWIASRASKNIPLPPMALPYSTCSAWGSRLPARS